MKRNKSPKPFKVVGKGGRRKNPETKITLKPTLAGPQNSLLLNRPIPNASTR